MPDLAVTRSTEARRMGGVNADAHGGERREPAPEEQRPRREYSSPELAVALGEAVTVVYEQGANGESLIRVLDNERGETLAVVTPEQLLAMTADTGLPPGLLVRLAS